jgi:hypothetical protein
VLSPGTWRIEHAWNQLYSAKASGSELAALQLRFGARQISSAGQRLAHPALNETLIAAL